MHYQITVYPYKNTFITNEYYLKLLYIEYVIYLETVFHNRENKIMYSKKNRKLKIFHKNLKTWHTF